MVIPETIGGVSVTTIGGFAFHNLSITSVYIPESVTYIGVKAFNRNGLTNVHLDNTEAEIECQAFGDPSTITTHNLPDTYVNDWSCGEN